jgi:hypothetical protein
MNLENIEEKIEQASKKSKKDLSSTLLDFLSFYSEYRIKGTDLSEDGDMLLFQWGTYDRGQGEYFEFDITRQIIFSEEMEQEYEGMQQLHVTFRFIPTDETTTLSSGNKWCSEPKELESFKKYILESDAYKWSSVSTPSFSEIYLERE